MKTGGPSTKTSDRTGRFLSYNAPETRREEDNCFKNAFPCYTFMGWQIPVWLSCCPEVCFTFVRLASFCPARLLPWSLARCSRSSWVKLLRSFLQYSVNEWCFVGTLAGVTSLFYFTFVGLASFCTTLSFPSYWHGVLNRHEWRSCSSGRNIFVPLPFYSQHIYALLSLGWQASARLSRCADCWHGVGTHVESPCVWRAVAHRFWNRCVRTCACACMRVAETYF